MVASTHFKRMLKRLLNDYLNGFETGRLVSTYSILLSAFRVMTPSCIHSVVHSKYLYFFIQINK